jgi:hypothetical protein
VLSVAQKIRAIREACPERSRMDPWFKIGDFSISFQSKTLIPNNKNQSFQKFLTVFITLSYESRQSIFEDFFRIKSAGGSNYRGATFSPPPKATKYYEPAGPNPCMP